MTLDELRQALGKVAYERYVEANDGVIEHLPANGDQMAVIGLPPWDALGLMDRIIWTHVAGAVLDTATRALSWQLQAFAVPLASDVTE